jgi:hypothetical protein
LLTGRGYLPVPGERCYGAAGESDGGVANWHDLGHETARRGDVETEIPWVKGVVSVVTAVDGETVTRGNHSELCQTCVCLALVNCLMMNCWDAPGTDDLSALELSSCRVNHRPRTKLNAMKQTNFFVLAFCRRPVTLISWYRDHGKSLQNDDRAMATCVSVATVIGVLVVMESCVAVVMGTVVAVETEIVVVVAICCHGDALQTMTCLDLSVTLTCHDLSPLVILTLICPDLYHAVTLTYRDPCHVATVTCRVSCRRVS